MHRLISKVLLLFESRSYSEESSRSWGQGRENNEEENTAARISWAAKRTFIKPESIGASVKTGFKRSEDPVAYKAEVQRLFVLAFNLSFGRRTLCYLCGCVLTYDRRALRYIHGGVASMGGTLITSTNFSPDRRVHTDNYGHVTTWPCCWGCNCIKSGFPEANARVLLENLASASHIVENGFIKRANASTPGLPRRLEPPFLPTLRLPPCPRTLAA